MTIWLHHAGRTVGFELARGASASEFPEYNRGAERPWGITGNGYDKVVSDGPGRDCHRRQARHPPESSGADGRSWQEARSGRARRSWHLAPRPAAPQTDAQRLSDRFPLRPQKQEANGLGRGARSPKPLRLGVAEPPPDQS